MKRILIVGATSGIGYELALVFAKHGYKVGITGRREEELEKLKRVNPDFLFPKAFDVTKLSQSARNMEEVTTAMGGLDMVVISAGTGDLNEEIEFEIEKHTIETNVLGFTCIADWAFNYFKKQKYGHLVAITSVGGLRGNRQAPSYNATKAFQINYMEGLRQKCTFLKMPIYTTEIRPGFVATRMAKGDGQFWVAPTKKAAKQIYHAIQKKKKIAYVTKRWRLIGILLKLIPGFMYDRM